MYVQVRRCRDTDKGEGLFVREDVEEGAILSFYNGVRLAKEEAEEPSEAWEDDAYKILDQTEEENVLDIPERFRGLDTYCASLAHKTNHSFRPGARFCLFDHPRFGDIPAIKSLRPLTAGTEVLVNYQYSFDSAPPWYQQLNVSNILEAYTKTRY